MKSKSNSIFCKEVRMLTWLRRCSWQVRPFTGRQVRQRNSWFPKSWTVAKDYSELKLTDFSEILSIPRTNSHPSTLCGTWLGITSIRWAPGWMAPWSISIEKGSPMRVSEACKVLLKMEKVDFKERRATAQVCCLELRKLLRTGLSPTCRSSWHWGTLPLKYRHWENIQKLK